MLRKVAKGRLRKRGLRIPVQMLYHERPSRLLLSLKNTYGFYHAQIVHF